MNFSLFIKYLLLRIFLPRRLLTLEYRLFSMLNYERKKRGLHKLFFQNDLRRVARKHSLDMAKKDYFAHENLDRLSPKERNEKAMVSEVISGENLAKVRGFADCVKTAHVGLMESPGHKENILRESFNCVGIGAAVSDDKTYYFTQNFSHRIIVLRGAKSKIKFKSKIKLTGYVLDSGVENVYVLVKKNGKEYYEEVYDLGDGMRFRFDLTFKCRGEYEVSVFAGDNKLSLCNQFKLTKKGFLW